MKLKEYLESLQDLVKAHPQVLELPVIYSKDDEGNFYKNVHYTPSLTFFEDGEVDTVNHPDAANSVCIN